MRVKVLALSAALAAAALTGGAHAATFDFGYAATSGFEVAAGSFTTDASGLVTSISGDAAGPSFGDFGTITGVSSYAGADNTYFTTSPHFDFAGLSFATSTGIDYNLFSCSMVPAGGICPGGSTYFVSNSMTNGTGVDTGASSPVTLDITEVGSAVPEPSTWALMIAGVAMLGGMLRFARGRRLGAIAA